nr:malignant T-cell-amplified sequence 1 homolog [Ipomoea batatas]
MAGEDAKFFLVEDCDFVVNLMPMFSSEEVSGQNQVKASVQRKIRQSIAEEYPGLEPVLDDLLPKKSPLIVAKCFMFSFLYADPNIMKKLQVDRGAIKYVLSGANIMCPGLTSPGGALDVEVGAETPVAIMAEGKQHALAIGFTKMSAKDINSKDDRKELSARTKVKAAAHHQELQKVFAVSIA